MKAYYALASAPTNLSSANAKDYVSLEFEYEV